VSVVRCSSSKNNPIIKFDPRLQRKAKRNYCREEGWMKRYLQAAENGDVIDTTWAVQNHYSENRAAARKHLNRDCKAGTLIAIRTYPRSYKLTKNVTLHKAATQPRPIIDQNQEESNLCVKMSTKHGLFCQSLQKKEHSLHAATTMAKVATPATPSVSSNASAAYTTAFSDCHCNGSYICDSCQRLPTVFSTAFDRLQSVITGTIPSSLDVAVPCSKPSIPPTLIPASELQRVKAPTYSHWTRYGLLGRRWHEEALLAYDAIDKLQPNVSLRPVHRLYFETYDERSAFSREFETQLIRNKGRRADITVFFDGLSIPIHVERYKLGKVILKAELSETPISADRIPDFKHTVQVALPFETPPSET
jgi:hypothetical protein